MNDENEFVHPQLLRMEGYEIPDSLEEILELYASDDPHLRRLAAYELGNFNEPSVVEKLHGLLDDPDKWIRVCAIQALGNLEDKTAVEPLCEIAGGGEVGHEIRTNVLRALADIGDPRALPTLIQLLTSENAFTRYDAAFALGEIGDSEAIPHLQAIVSDDAMPEEGDTDTIWSVGEMAQRSINTILGIEGEDEDWGDEYWDDDEEEDRVETDAD